MLKLKIIVSMLAVAGLVMLLMGSTYLTTSLAVICTAIALPLALHLTFRWFVEDSHDSLLWFFSVVWVIMSVLGATNALQDIGAMDVPLSATIDPVWKVVGVGYHVSLMSLVSILLAVVVPRSPKCSDDDGNSDKG